MAHRDEICHMVPVCRSTAAGSHWHWHGTGMRDAAPVNTSLVGSSITLSPGSYMVSLSLQATPQGTTVELLKGAWSIASDGVKEMAPWARCTYHGLPVATVTAGRGGGWAELRATVHVPPATAGHNGTALQLRLTPPPSARGWGATVWLDNAAIRPLAPADEE